MAISSKIKNRFKKTGPKKLIPFAIVFIAGILFGGLVANLYGNISKSDSSHESSQRNEEDRAKRNVERVEEGYAEAKQDIAKDEESGRISKDQADKIRAKLDELYKFVTENPGVSSEERTEIRQKRQEWRDWAKENKISSRYFIRIY